MSVVEYDLTCRVEQRAPLVRLFTAMLAMPLKSFDRHLCLVDVGPQRPVLQMASVLCSESRADVQVLAKCAQEQ